MAEVLVGSNNDPESEVFVFSGRLLDALNIVRYGLAVTRCVPFEAVSTEDALADVLDVGAAVYEAAILDPMESLLASISRANPIS